MSKFNLVDKPKVDPAALAKFAAGAEDRSIPPVTTPGKIPAPVAASSSDAKVASTSLLRFEPQERADFEFVFKHSTYKSRQKFMMALLLGEIAKLKADVLAGIQVGPKE